jgi:hypothetical protein
LTALHVPSTKFNSPGLPRVMIAIDLPFPPTCGTKLPLQLFFPWNACFTVGVIPVEQGQFSKDTFVDVCAHDTNAVFFDQRFQVGIESVNSGDEVHDLLPPAFAGLTAGFNVHPMQPVNDESHHLNSSQTGQSRTNIRFAVSHLSSNWSIISFKELAQPQPVCPISRYGQMMA